MPENLKVPAHMKPLAPKRVSVRVVQPPKCAPCEKCICLCADAVCLCCDNSCVAPARFFYSK